MEQGPGAGYTGTMKPIRTALLLLLLPGAVARAEDADPAAQSALCSSALSAAEARHGTPSGLLGAIARTESGRPIPGMRGVQPWPWAINADGAARYFDDKAQAVRWATDALARGVRFMDVGCMQVNLQYHPRAFRDLDDAFDPSSNADYAARFLKQLSADAGGNWYAAVGHYHSQTPGLAGAYRERVAAVAQGRDPPPNAWQPLYVRAIRQGSLRLALAGGGTLVVKMRQPAARGHRRMDACRAAAMLAPVLSRSVRTGCAASAVADAR